VVQEVDKERPGGTVTVGTPTCNVTVARRPFGRIDETGLTGNG
jgi:hypothetical protein